MASDELVRVYWFNQAGCHSVLIPVEMEEKTRSELRDAGWTHWALKDQPVKSVEELPADWQQ